MIKNLLKEYRSALKDFLAGGGETALENAYLLGRQALEQGMGMLDIVAVHHQILAALLGRPDDSTSETRIVKQASKFLAECLSPFEMAQRGFRESIAELNRLNEMLEDQVEQRTQAMRVSEERYRTLIEVSPDAIIMTDLQGKVILCNQESARLHGYSSPDELIGIKLAGSIAPEDMPHVKEISQSVISTGTIGSSEYTMIGKDGARRPVESRTALIRDQDGKPNGFVGITRDISERQHAQSKLVSHAHREATLADLGLRALSGVEMNTLMQATIHLVAQNLDVEYCELLELLPEKNSLILREGLGWKEGLVGNTIIQAGEGSQAGYTLLTTQPVIVENLPQESRFIPPAFLIEHNIIAGMTVIIYGKDQPYGILGVHTSQPREFTVEDANFLQSIANVLAMAIDNRRLLETESKARQSAEERSQQSIKSLAFVSHELRTPLTSIKGFASTLLAEDVVWSAEQQRDFIQTINEEANKLDGFIEQLLDLSKMGAGAFKFSVTRQSVESLVAVARIHLQMLAEQHNLVLNIQDALPDVIADTQRAEQILANLVGNATKYAPAGTTISISVQSRENFAEFSVADEGPGIPTQEREKIFQPFYRVLDKATLKAKGAGLGLTICQRLVEGQGGRIWIDERPGPGAVIKFTLPLADLLEKQSEQNGQDSHYRRRAKHPQIDIR